ncbi:nitrogen fixation protein NifS [Helicobacter burdigaliensis]|uniref:nitrogen fixation protein NifS n=1 Tax=Helicobacter burdigaliensis TaxID=2315334 RepID=UPI000EF75539|nr:nitrogen fixation protein NifS [Helicobacter burdigaliensis]
MLDYLQNPPTNWEFMGLIGGEFVRPKLLNPNVKMQIRAENEELCKELNMKIAKPFSFSVESFYFLLKKLVKKYKVALALSSHRFLYEAYLLLEEKDKIIPLIPSYEKGEICIQEALTLGAECFVLPCINEDILTSNLHLQEALKDKICIWDISYALALSLPLPKGASAYLINGESMGLLYPFGILAHSCADFGDFNELYLEIFGLYRAFLESIKKHTPLKQDYAPDFFNALKDILQDSLVLSFKTPKNTLAIRLKDNKARNLIQALMLEDISCINGQECLFGFMQPSFVLRLMGFDTEEAREFLSLSFCKEFDIQSVAKKIAFKYKQFQAMQ